MTRLPRPEGRELVVALRSEGFDVVRVRGSHHFRATQRLETMERDLFVTDELEQLEANRRSLEARYASPKPLLFPAAVVYFVPAGMAGDAASRR